MKAFVSLLTHRVATRISGLALVPALALAVGLALPGAGVAQNLFAPVVQVNDQVVTAYELSQRIAFMRLLGAPGDLEQLSMDRLIEERLQLDAARQMGIQLNEEGLQAGMAEFAGRANLEVDAFVAAIAQEGIAKETFRDFVGVGLLWREVVRARFVSRIQITEAEIDRAIALTQPGAGVRVLLSEIILPANTPETKRASEARAARLSEITTLPAFAQAARNFSVAPSKARSGRMDWIDLSDLPPLVAAKVLPLSPGQVTEPIPVRNAIAVFQMRDILETDSAAPEDVSIEYATYFLPGGAGAQAEAAKIRDEVDTCDDLYGIAKGQPEERLVIEVLPVAEIPADYAMELAQLDDNEVSTALTTADGQNLVFLMLCGRTRVLPEEVSRDEVLAQLRNQRIQAYANSYLEELKSDAHIEYLDGR